jgi:quercetin dioxygenase-like cupin family protein
MKEFRNLLSELQKHKKDITKLQILNREHQNVLLVQMKKNQEIEAHPESYAVLFYIIKGSAIFTSGEGQHNLTENSALYLETNERRGIKALEDLLFLGIQMFN